MDKKYKILLVDDDPFLLEVCSQKIKKLGLDVETLEHPTKDFAQTVVEIKPDLIALDTLMPEMNGFEAIQILKANPRTKDIPVMFVTNQGETDDIKQGLSLGAVDYIVLPSLTPSELAKCYFDYLCDPQNYIKRCGV